MCLLSRSYIFAKNIITLSLKKKKKFQLKLQFCVCEIFVNYNHEKKKYFVKNGIICVVYTLEFFTYAPDTPISIQFKAVILDWTISVSFSTLWNKVHLYFFRALQHKHINPARKFFNPITFTAFFFYLYTFYNKKNLFFRSVKTLENP